MEGIGHGKATLGKFGGSAGGDVTFFLTVEAENFPLAGKRYDSFFCCLPKLYRADVSEHRDDTTSFLREHYLLNIINTNFTQL